MINQVTIILNDKTEVNYTEVTQLFTFGNAITITGKKDNILDGTWKHYLSELVMMNVVFK